jgi:hypothetical protein
MDGVGVGVMDGVGVGVMDGVGVGVMDGVGVGVMDGVGVGVMDGVGVGILVGVGCVPVGVTVGMGVDVGIGVGVSVGCIPVGITVGVAFDVGFRVIVLSAVVMVNMVTSGFTTCMALVSKCNVVETFCAVVLAYIGMVASSNGPVGGLALLAGSSASDRSITPVELASLAVVCLTTRVKGEGLVDTSPVSLTSVGSKTIFTVVNATGLSAVSHNWKVALGGITTEPGWMEICTVLVPARVGAPCRCCVARKMKYPVIANSTITRKMPTFFVRWGERKIR